MKKLASIIGIVAMFLLHQNRADAQTWISCGTCTTDAQFKATARSAHGLQWGGKLYGVVNPNTAKFLWVQVNRPTRTVP
jgi:hypothetical protein